MQDIVFKQKKKNLICLIVNVVQRGYSCMGNTQNHVTVVKWLDCMTCNHKVVGSNPQS